MKVDLSKVKGGGMYLEPGTYLVRITDVEYRQVNGKDSFRVKFTDETGASVNDDYFLTDAAMWRVRRLAEALGFAADQMADFDTEELRGKSCMISVIKETGKDGKQYARVSKFWREAEMSAAEFASSSVRGKKAAAPVESQAPAQVNDEEDPF